MNLSAMTLAEIKRYVHGFNDCVPDDFRQALGRDPRSGVQELLQVLDKRRCRYLEEQKRLEGLWHFENRLFSQGVEVVAGTDEAGRGPLAGPVVASAVVLPDRVFIKGLNDSKKLTPVVRSSLAMEIRKVARYWSVGLATVEEILKLNIHHASMLAMKRALEGLEKQPEHVLVDGFPIPGLKLPQTAIVGGDGKSASIAAASILAKVTRDDLMEQIHLLYPQYGFDRHKGYGTQEHLRALHCFGPCPHHRHGFAPIKDSVK